MPIVGQIDGLQPDLLGQSADQVRLFDQAEVDEDAASDLGVLRCSSSACSNCAAVMRPC